MQSRPLRALFEAVEAHFEEQQDLYSLATYHSILLSPLFAFAVASTRSLPAVSVDITRGQRKAIQVRFPLCQTNISRVRFRGYSDLEICRIAGDIALIHDIPTSSPLLFIRSTSFRQQPIEHIQRLGLASDICYNPTSFPRKELARRERRSNSAINKAFQLPLEHIVGPRYCISDWKRECDIIKGISSDCHLVCVERCRKGGERFDTRNGNDFVDGESKWSWGKSDEEDQASASGL